MSLKLRPISFKNACDFVGQHHRHHRAPQGHKFSISVCSRGETVGVVIVGRPVSRMLDDGLTAEVIRLCTSGDRNACSMLYGAAARAAKAMGYARIITYTLSSEHGSSLRAAGWVKDKRSAGGSWNRGRRERKDTHPLGEKSRWLCVLGITSERSIFEEFLEEFRLTA